MAEELGSGWLSILPSLKGFKKRLQADLKKELRGVDAEVKVKVVPDVDRKAFAAALATLGRGHKLKVPVELDRTGELGGLKPIRQKVKLDVDKGGLLGRLFGGKASVDEKIKVSTDVDKANLRRVGSKVFAGAGGEAADFFLGGFQSVLTNPFIGIPAAVLAAMGTIVIGTAAAAATVAGAGLGAIFVGAFLLKDDPELKAAATGLIAQVKSVLTEAVKPLKGPFLEALGLIGEGFKIISPDIKAFFGEIAKSGAIQELGRGIKGFLKSFSETGALEKLGKAIGPVLSQIGMALPDLGNALAQFLISVSKPETAQFIGQLFRGIADAIRVIGSIIGWLTDHWDDFVSALKTGWSVLKAVWDVVSFIGGAIKLAFEALSIGGAVLFGDLTTAKQWLKDWITDVKSWWSGLVDWAKKIFGLLPGKIKSALGDTGSMLLQAGKNIIGGLINGIKEKFGDLKSAVSNAASIIGDYLVGHSPTKKGPLSGSGWTYAGGQLIASDLAAGVESKLPVVATASSQLAAQFGVAGPPSAKGPAAAATKTVAVPGDRMTATLIQMLRDAIGADFEGDVTFALGGR